MGCLAPRLYIDGVKELPERFARDELAIHRYPQLDTTAPLTPPARPLTQTPPNAIPDRGSYAEVAGAVQGDVQVGAAAAPDVLSVTLLAPCR